MLCFASYAAEKISKKLFQSLPLPWSEKKEQYGELFRDIYSTSFDSVDYRRQSCVAATSMLFVQSVIKWKDYSK